MSIKEATHTGSNGKYFYKESGVRYTIDGFKRYPREYQPMMFWDAHLINGARALLTAPT